MASLCGTGINGGGGHHRMAADGEGGNDRAGMLGDVFLISINKQK